MTVRDEDWELLELEPGSDAAAVRRAWRRRRALYESESLATYNLLDEGERAAMLDRIDAAYERIAGAAPAPAVGEHAGREPSPAPEPPPTGPPPDAAAEPGLYLRHRRLARGLNLHEISRETKIGVNVLEHIEGERFASLPAPVFVRGHVLQFARELGLENADELARAYIAKMQADVER